MRLTAGLYTAPQAPHVAIFALFLASAAAAQSVSSPDDVTKRLEQMQQEIERLRDDNRAMRTELHDLRAASGDHWLTEKRAEEIRTIVHDVLADADTRASLLGDGLMAGWSDGFFLADAHGRFRLEIQGQVQVRWMYNYHAEHMPATMTAGETTFFAPADIDRHRQGFELGRTRLTFRGHVFSPDLTYLVRGGFAHHREAFLPPFIGTGFASPEPRGGDFHLLDAWVRFHLSDEWSLRVGQFKLPFSREQLVSSAYQLAVERSVIDNRLNIGRSTGIDLTWLSGPHRATVVVSHGGSSTIGGPISLAGTHDGSATGIGAVAPAAEYAVTARYDHLIAGQWRQFQDFTGRPEDEFGLMAGVAVHFQRTEAAPLQLLVADKWLALTVDVSAEWGGANAFAAFTYHRFDGRVGPAFLPGIGGIKNETWGLVVQGGFYVAPKWEVFGRYEYGDWNRRRLPATPAVLSHLEQAMHLVTAGVNYYIDGHDVKWTTDLGVGLTRVSHAWGWNPAPITGWRAASGGDPLQIVFRTQLQLLF